MTAGFVAELAADKGKQRVRDIMRLVCEGGPDLTIGMRSSSSDANKAASPLSHASSVATALENSN